MSLDAVSLVAGIGAGFSIIPLGKFIFRALTVSVEDECSVVVTYFGKIVRIISDPGLNFLPAKILPWSKVREVSRQLDFRRYESIQINDSRGTTLLIDLWIELKILAPEKALFAVADWEKSLQSLLVSAAIANLGFQEFGAILLRRNELGESIRRDLTTEASRWGISLERVFISNLGLLPDVAQQLFDTVAAGLERTKANIEESGRLKAVMLEAATSAEVSALVTEAKGQYSLAVGRAYHKLAPNPQLLDAYNELYELSLLKPHRTVSFHGFKSGEIAAVDAAMIGAEHSHAMGPLLAERENGAFASAE